MLKVLTTIILMLLMVPIVASAHGGGITWSANAGEYYVDVDYDGYTIEAGRAGRLVFTLYKDEARTTPIKFTDLWVRLEAHEGDRSRTFFAGPIHLPEYGGAGFLYVFPKEGTYTLEVRYNNGSKELAQASFELQVESDPTEHSFNFGLELWLGIAAGAALVAAAGGGWYFIRTRI